MAERVPPTPPPPGPPMSIPAPSPSSSPATAIATSPEDGQPNLRSGTYVVQVPKDQIYRVPPPENAYLAERYRNNHQNRQKRRSPCLSCLYWLFAAFLLLAILFLVITVIFFLVIRPRLPSFAVDRILVKAQRSPASSNQKPEYSFMMRSQNPSVRMGFSYERGGKAILVHRNVDIANGGAPSFYQGYRNATVFELVLHASKVVLPREIKRSLNGSKEIVPLSLSIDFPVRLTIGGIQMWAMRMSVACDVKGRTLGKRTRIASQVCGVKLRT